MKKVLSLALALVMVLGLAVPAAAATKSPTGTANGLKPFLIDATSEDYAVYTTEDIADLPEEAQKTFAEAKENLAAAAPEDMAARYFFYFKTDKPCSAVFNLDNYKKLVIMQYVDGKWVELEFIVNVAGSVKVLNEDGELVELDMKDLKVKVSEDGTVKIVDENGELVDLEVADEEIQLMAENTVTVLNVVEGPIVIFVQ